jgi:ligand-binding sensor domain-containing protein
MAAAALMALALGFVGCSADEKADVSSGLVVEVIDSVASAIAQSIVDSQIVPVTETNTVELAVKTLQSETGLPPVNAIFVKESLAYAGFDGGLLIYDLKTGEYSVSFADENFRAVTEYGGAIFVGGDELYEVDGADLVPVAESVPGTINALCAYGPSLMIGSTEGLYARNLIGLVTMLQDVEISALTESDRGLWIGTAGEGLYQFDNFEFKRRYLQRDSTLFDDVTALAYNHRHLYMGTTRGMFVFDGGRWETVSTDDGLPTDQVTSIDASGWVVYVGTTGGLSSYFDNAVTPVDRIGSYAITAVGRSGNQVIAGTATNGIILKVGPSIKTLVEPWQQGDELAVMLH